MVFGFLKKKEEVMDLRKRDSDMPIPVKMRERLITGQSSSSLVSSSATSSSTPESSNSGGGFFSFFGGSSDSSSSSSNNLNSSSNNSSSSDLLGGISNAGSLSNSDSEKLQTQLGDLMYKFSRQTDRLELAEKKIERLERKLGIGNE